MDEAARTVTFHDDWLGRDYGVLALTVAWERTHCGTAATSWATSAQWNGVMESDGFRLEMREDGALVVNGEEVPRGGQATFNGTGVFPDGRAWTSATIRCRERRLPVFLHFAGVHAGLPLAKTIQRGSTHVIPPPRAGSAMTSVTGTSTPLLPLRRALRPGDIGHLGTCPLCSHAKGAPPCLACRDELRARVLDLHAATYAERAVN